MLPFQLAGGWTDTGDMLMKLDGAFSMKPWLMGVEPADRALLEGCHILQLTLSGDPRGNLWQIMF